MWRECVEGMWRECVEGMCECVEGMCECVVGMCGGNVWRECVEEMCERVDCGLYTTVSVILYGSFTVSIVLCETMKFKR